MSLILEALRKSEAERRLGSAPDVLAPMPVMRAATPQSRWPIIAAAVIAAMLIVAAISWWLHSASESSTRTEPRQLAGNETHDEVHRAKLGTPATHTAANDSQMASTLPVITLPTTSEPQPRAASVKNEHADSERIEPSTSASTHMAAPIAAIPRPTKTNTTEVFPSTIAIDLKPAAAEPATPAPKPTVAAEPALPLLSELPADERGALPALSISMHVYADDPAQRFMIVDGHRLGEGARIADGVTLVRIRRDGAELDVHGRRVLLPNP